MRRPTRHRRGQGRSAGEFVFPLLLISGLLGRYAALGLSAVNVMAVVSYPILLEKGFEAAVKDHYLWGLGAAVLVVFGVGRWSLDGWLACIRADKAADLAPRAKARGSTERPTNRGRVVMPSHGPCGTRA